MAKWMCVLIKYYFDILYIISLYLIYSTFFLIYFVPFKGPITWKMSFSLFIRVYCNLSLAELCLNAATLLFLMPSFRPLGADYKNTRFWFYAYLHKSFPLKSRPRPCSLFSVNLFTVRASADTTVKNLWIHFVQPSCYSFYHLSTIFLPPVEISCVHAREECCLLESKNKLSVWLFLNVWIKKKSFLKGTRQVFNSRNARLWHL